MLEAVRYFVMFGDIVLALITFWFMRGMKTGDKALTLGFGIMFFLFAASAGLIWR